MQSTTNPGQGYERAIFNITNTNFSLTYNSPQQSFIAIGKQQWGSVYVEYSTNHQTTYYPIAFPSAVLVNVISSGYNGSSNNTCRNQLVHTQTLSSFTTYWTFPKSYVSVGYQQWGYISSAQVPTTITLPIAFTTSAYMVVANTKWTSGDLFALATNVSSNSQILIYGYKNASSQPAYWICIGKQQWGVVPASNEGTELTITYPIKYVSAVYLILNCQSTSGNNGSYTNAGYIKQYSNTSFIFHNWAYNGTGYWWIALGK